MHIYRNQSNWRVDASRAEEGPLKDGVELVRLLVEFAGFEVVDCILDVLVGAAVGGDLVFRHRVIGERVETAGSPPVAIARSLVDEIGIDVLCV